ncbi:tRNA uridine-5-carboxymethylaminomethyl(34) synthesis GTPase MnmE [Desulfococcus multivorans]|uniref:tRNA modification GTPase MnmE n=1 Tax=Desulfococcus multivorans DSM 2059 TaxID=1121405 RepID=S7ULG5_DESML|nr:tRNA uridine-5-carboxymethylaminomethyl(34) synthesis GTPase MnmE [Desulfococcus multivorans]AOY60641.1 MnmE: tRNA modification GTPase [Desulfococcus multivorans]AQV02728.1 tRNA modification GTPase [Desulfococcus multivorans]EPR34699.1 tRNA modification GTPase mnmE [Desulfococcus multivorans DSM 2059]SKA03183.1 tRNA modification GTPase [Desulfococcus multivorans DSM 2059]
MTISTIAAIATPMGVGGIGIVRISGPDALQIAQTVFQPSHLRRRSPTPFILKSHRLHHGRIVDPDTGRILDEVLLVWMKAPHSYTREDVVEIQMHSGPAVVRAVLGLVLRHGAVPAEPGEFTRRAFLSGRIDLTQAEAVIDIISARTDSALHIATAQLQGALRQHIESLRKLIRGVLAETEAAIDFPDDVGGDIDDGWILKQLEQEALSSLRSLAARYDAGHILRDGLKVVVAGKPNVGKSSLMNCLLDQDRAIVTDLPGTTRDFIEENLVVRGIPILLTDTAGLRSTEDLIEKIGVERTLSRIEGADLVLFVTAAGSPITDEDTDLFEIVRHKAVIWVLNKCDLDPLGNNTVFPDCWRSIPRVSISARYNQGIDTLKQKIEALALQPSLAYESAIIPNLRQKHAIDAAVAALMAAAEGIRCGMPFELVNLDIRSAYDLLGEILGVTIRDDILDYVFERFCVGK